MARMGALLVAATAALAGTASAHAPDLTHLRLGDGRVSLTAPKRGYVYACQPGQTGVPVPTGPWISGSFWDFTRKPTVDGAVDWPAASYSVRRVGSKRKLSGNALPTHRTGVFPIQPSDDAYRYDRNANKVAAQSVSLSISAKPRKAARRSCLPGGTIGVLNNGVALFNALDAANSDAPAHEIVDRCGGHPAPGDLYHYHALPRCMSTGSSHHHSKRIGWALDGFPIYGPCGRGGRYMRNRDLDACHGHTHVIKIDGKRVRMYHYHATMEYPYTLGCFRGTPVSANRGAPPPMMGAPPGF